MACSTERFGAALVDDSLATFIHTSGSCGAFEGLNQYFCSNLTSNYDTETRFLRFILYLHFEKVI